VRAGTGFQFTEGPAADASGTVYFSDVRASRIHRWAAGGGVTPYREQSGGANGLYFTPAGRLVVCESQSRRIVDDDLAGQLRVLADAYDGKKLNSPNDIWVRPDGGIYFTDPRYGSQAGVEQDGMHTYFIPPDGGPLLRVTSDLTTPNGVDGTPDGETVYIADAGAGQVWRYKSQPDGTLTEKSAFVPRSVDGMTLDERLNVYLATGPNIEIYDAAGQLLQAIAFPEQPSNVAFGGPDFRTLFVTARSSVYTLAMTVRGAPAPVAPEPTATAIGGGTATNTATSTATSTPDLPATATPGATTPAPPPAIRLFLPRALKRANQ
jgi:gluconolactonase